MIREMKLALEIMEIAIKSGDWKVDGMCDPNMALVFLRQAIAEASENGLYREGYRNGYGFGEAAGLRQAIEQAQKQEPVTWGVDWGKAGDIPCVNIIKRLPDGGIEVLACEYAPYLYTSPPQRQWVGLTDKEIDEWTPEIHVVIRAIEAKLKDKNEIR